MDLIDKRQVAPLMISAVLVFLIAMLSFAFVRLSGDTPAQANLHFWYMERSAGLIAYILLTLTVLLGITGKAALWDRLKARRAVTLLHQFSSLLLLPFVALHLIGIHSDSSVPFTWSQMFTPGTATYRAFGTALGTLSFYLLLLILLSSFLRRAVLKLWRSLHYLTYVLFVGVTFHGFLAGTDSAKSWVLLLYLSASTVFVIALLRRFFFKDEIPQAPGRASRGPAGGADGRNASTYRQTERPS